MSSAGVISVTADEWLSAQPWMAGAAAVCLSKPADDSASEPKAARLLFSLTVLLLVGCTYTHAKCADFILHPPVCPTQLIGMPTSCCMVGYVAARGSVARPQPLSTLTESEGAGMAQRGCPLRGVSADSSPGLNSKPPESALLLQNAKIKPCQKLCDRIHLSKCSSSCGAFVCVQGEL